MATTTSTPDAHDIRLRLTDETWCVLASEARATGKSQQDIARDWLHGIAVSKIDKASVLLRLLRSKGIDPATAGVRRIDADGAGTATEGAA